MWELVSRQNVSGEEATLVSGGRLFYIIFYHAVTFGAQLPLLCTCDM